MTQVSRYIRPARVFLIAVALGLIIGLILNLVFKPLLVLLQDALYFRISKPLEIIQGPLTPVMGTEEAVTAMYLLVNNTFVSLVAAFGGVALVRWTMSSDQAPASTGRFTDFIHGLLGEGSETYKERSLIIFLLPLAVVFMNGLVLGLFSTGQGLDLRAIWIYLAYIMPHGILELPAVVLAAILGYANAVNLNNLLEKGELDRFHRRAGNILRSRRAWSVFMVVIIMLVSAAFIETYFTPAFGRDVLQRSYFNLRVLNSTVNPGETAFLEVWASFGTSISFYSGSPEGPPLEVSVFGSDTYPFKVGGKIIEGSEVVKTSSLTIPQDLPSTRIRFSVNRTRKVFIVAEVLDLREVGNLTVQS